MSNSIEYVLKRNAKKNINITIKDDGTVMVSAPKRVSIAEINKVIESKKEWIEKARTKQSSKKIIKTDIDGNTTIMRELKENDIFSNLFFQNSEDEIYIISNEYTEVTFIDYYSTLKNSSNNTIIVSDDAFLFLEKYGIKVILDGVFSHTGSDSIYFNRIALHIYHSRTEFICL